MADNFRFDMTGVALNDALAIAFTQHEKAVGWAELDAPDGGRRRLVLTWHENGKANALPAPMGLEAVVSFVLAWLDAADYGREPDIDGDCKKGCRVYNEAWGYVADNHYAFVAIEPVWLMYGK